jgi:fatty acid desaturase
MVRDAILIAGTSLHRLVPRRAERRLRRPILIGAGFLATGTAMALVHLAGVDPRVWIAPGQSGLVPGLVEVFLDKSAPPEAS